MKSLKYEFIGWHQSDGSDKIWGAIELIKPKSSSYWRHTTILGKYLTFWGKRGTRYQTKFLDSLCPVSYYWYSTIAKKIEEKKRKGYIEVSSSRLHDIYPDFEKDLLDVAFWTMMTKTNKLSLEEWEEIKKEIF